MPHLAELTSLSPALLGAAVLGAVWVATGRIERMRPPTKAEIRRREREAQRREAKQPGARS